MDRNMYIYTHCKVFFFFSFFFITSSYIGWNRCSTNNLKIAILYSTVWYLNDKVHYQEKLKFSLLKLPLLSATTLLMWSTSKIFSMIWKLLEDYRYPLSWNIVLFYLPISTSFPTLGIEFRFWSYFLLWIPAMNYFLLWTCFDRDKNTKNIYGIFYNSPNDCIFW